MSRTNSGHKRRACTLPKVRRRPTVIAAIGAIDDKTRAKVLAEVRANSKGGQNDREDSMEFSEDSLAVFLARQLKILIHNMNTSVNELARRMDACSDAVSSALISPSAINLPLLRRLAGELGIKLP